MNLNLKDNKIALGLVFFFTTFTLLVFNDYATDDLTEDRIWQILLITVIGIPIFFGLGHLFQKIGENQTQKKKK